MLPRLRRRPSRIKAAIDVYEGAGVDEGATFVHIAEYQAPSSSVDTLTARRRFEDLLVLTPAVLGVRPGSFTRRSAPARAVGRSIGMRVSARSSRIRPKRACCSKSTWRVTWTRGCSSTIASRVESSGRWRAVSVSSTCSPIRALRPFTRPPAGRSPPRRSTCPKPTLIGRSATCVSTGFGAKARLSMGGAARVTGGLRDERRAEHEFVRADVMPWIVDARRQGRQFDFDIRRPADVFQFKAMGRRTMGCPARPRRVVGGRLPLARARGRGGVFLQPALV